MESGSGPIERLISNHDWRLLLRSRANVMVISSDQQRDRLLDVCRPFLHTPIYHWDDQSAALPPDMRTLLVDNVATLCTEHQAGLLACVRSRRPRCISFDRAPLYDRVTDGSFLDALYYALNTIYIVL